MVTESIDGDFWQLYGDYWLELEVAERREFLPTTSASLPSNLLNGNNNLKTGSGVEHYLALKPGSSALIAGILASVER